MVRAFAFAAICVRPRRVWGRAAWRRQARGSHRAQHHPTIATSAQAQQCLAALGRTGAGFHHLPDRYTGPGCSNLNTVQLRHLGGDARSVRANQYRSGPLPDRHCLRRMGAVRRGPRGAADPGQPAGAGSRRWAAIPAAMSPDPAADPPIRWRRRSTCPVSCWRTVAAFLWQRIGTARAREREFLRVIRRSACKRFGTVLSPDYNAAHRDHFHLERGDGSFCR